MQKLNLTFDSWTFSPGLISSLITLLLLPFFVYLSFWQFSRFQEKQKIQLLLESRTNGSVMTLGDLPLFANEKENQKEIEEIRYSPLKVTGSFLNQYPILLDNQIADRQVGYHVLIPFLPTGSEKLLLVDRGWISVGKNRSELPFIPPISGKISLIGTINFPIAPLQLKQNPLIQNTWPLRTSRIEFQILSTLFARELYPFILQLNPNDPNGFKIIPITLNMPATRHLGYAIQWIGLAIGVLIYYVIINCHSKKIIKPSS